MRTKTPNSWLLYQGVDLVILTDVHSLCWLCFVNLIETGVTQEEEISVENIPQSDWPIAMSD